MPLSDDDVAVRNAQAERIDVEDVVCRPLALRISMSFRDHGDRDIGARHGIDEPTSGLRVSEDLLKFQVPGSERFCKHLVQLDEEIARSDHIAKPTTTPARIRI